ncbi:glycosyltransferase family 4 protein [Neptuniibacter halophilus]|uniref:glycosyltransferase family 4 protein n=1 Tax=Neptuniibacter halophilus TaxID=651666 RepID=UPI0025738465|nr:glycosyltransferase family 4 protein [Neptuniibacter halophilus]
MTRLAIIRQRYRPDGGAERFVSQALAALAETSQLDVSVITRGWEGENRSGYQVLQCDPQQRGRVEREQAFAGKALQLLKEHQFDLVQSHERIPGCDIYRAGDGVHKVWLQQRDRVIGCLQRFWQQRSAFHRYQLATEKALFTHPELKAVICNSEMVKQEIIQHFATPTDKIHVIYNAVDGERFKPVTADQKQALKKKLGLATDKPVAIYVGSGFQRKGLEAAIGAVAKQPDYQLLVVGKDKKQRRYEKLAARLGCAERVLFAGVQKEMPEYYNAADLLLLPTLYDPFPNVILEAMSSGLPVITSRKCGGAEFIRQGEEGFVTDALDVDAMAAALGQLKDPQQWQRSSVAARQRVAACTPENLAGQLLALYQSLLSGTGGRVREPV